MIPALMVTAALHLPPAEQPPVVPPIASTAPARWQRFFDCVVHRESKGNPRAVNPSSQAAGIGQWLPAWRHGLPWLLYRRLLDVGVPHHAAKHIRESMPRLIQRWPLWAQEAAMVQVLIEGEHGIGRGWRHWYLSESRCQTLVPS